MILTLRKMLVLYVFEGQQGSHGQQTMKYQDNEMMMILTKTPLKKIYRHP